MRRLAGDVAVVTGGAGAIGQAIARAFVAQGASVALLDRDKTRLEAAKGSVMKGHPGATLSSAICDVAEAASVHQAVALVRDRHSDPDVLVNNAGMSIVGGVEDMPEEDWDRTFAANVTSVFLLSREVIPGMYRKGRGPIVNMASESAFIGFAMHSAYCASKAAMVHPSRSMAAADAKDGVRVNALCPGTIDTPLSRGFLAQQPDPEATHAQVLAMHPLGLGTPEDIAHAAVFLASDVSRYATGAPFLVDGGATAV